MPAVTRPPPQLQTYSTLPGSRSEPRLAFPTSALPPPPPHPVQIQHERQRSLTYRSIKKRFSNAITTSSTSANLSFGKNLKRSLDLSLSIPETDGDEDDLEENSAGVSPISRANRSTATATSTGRVTMMQTQTQQHHHQHHQYYERQQAADFGPPGGGRGTSPGQGHTLPAGVGGGQTKRGLFGISSRHVNVNTEPAGGHGVSPAPLAHTAAGIHERMTETSISNRGGEQQQDDFPDDSSIFTTDMSGLRRKGSTKTQSGTHINNHSHTNTKHQTSFPPPPPTSTATSTPSAASRIAQFFGGGRDKSSSRDKTAAGKKNQRPSTTDTNAGGPPPPFGQTRGMSQGQGQGINVRVEADNGTLIYDNHNAKFMPRPSDASFDPTMDAHQIENDRGNALLQPSSGTAGGYTNRLRTASGPAASQHVMDAQNNRPVLTGKTTTNRPFGFGSSKPRQPSQPLPSSNGGGGPRSQSRSGTPWKHPHQHPHSQTTAYNGGQEYPRTKAERNFRFTWEANPGIVDGKHLMGFGGDFGRKRVKTDVRVDGNGKVLDARGATEVKRLPYVMGYERSVLDCEAMIHEAFTQVCTGKATLYPDSMPPPKRILDIGTGIGLWPITMAQQWPECTVVGLDIAPIQTDLAALARAQALVGVQDGEDGKRAVDWEDLSKRVVWKIGNFLEGLPFDSESFDHVHLRFVGLGIPETAWENLLDECARVLKSGTGILEIVEMSKVLPAKTPMALRASFSSLMLSSFLQPYPFVTLRPALLSCGLSSKEAMNVTFRRSQLTGLHPASTIEQCLAAWVDSALGKGKHGRGRGMSGTGQAGSSSLRWGEQVLGERAVRAYEDGGEDDSDRAEAALSSTHESQRQQGDEREADEMTIVAWIVRK